MELLEEGNRHTELRRVGTMNNINTLYLILDDRSISVTTSIGYISLPQAGTCDIDLNWEKALHLGDAAFYMPKRRGHNQAIGVFVIDLSQGEFGVLLQGDLEDAITRGIVKIEKLAGPLMLGAVNSH